MPLWWNCGYLARLLTPKREFNRGCSGHILDGKERILGVHSVRKEAQSVEISGGFHYGVPNNHMMVLARKALVIFISLIQRMCHSDVPLYFFRRLKQ